MSRKFLPLQLFFNFLGLWNYIVASYLRISFGLKNNENFHKRCSRRSGEISIEFPRFKEIT